MANPIFRSDASMQDTGAPKLVLFNLIPEPLTVPASLPFPAAYLDKNLVQGTDAAGNPTLALRITCSQLVPIEKPKTLLVVGSDRRCNLILDRAHADPFHCRILAQLNSGFDVWIIRDHSTSGTYYKRLERQEDPHNNGEVERLGQEELVHKDSIAVQGLRYLRVGPYIFNCDPTKNEAEKAERDRWFCRHEPVLVSKQLLATQLKGKIASLIQGRKIGEGGFGQVSEYMEKHTGLLFAVKKLMSSNDREFNNFLREAQSMEKLEHRNVVSRIDHYEEPAEDGKRVFLIVMPLFRCSLRYAVGRMNPVGIRNAFCQVIEGLKYLHSRGFLHRDIKPENIFISALTPPFDATLGDLGILSPVDAVGRGAGTRIYKAPEVYYDDLQSPATDVYALGVTLLQMVDERARKGGYDGMTKWIEDIRDHPPPAPFSRLIMQMLAPYPPSLRPTLDTVQKHLLEQKDLPESVQQPGLSLSEAMKKLEERRAKSALGDRQVALAVPLKNPVEAHPKLKKTVLHQGSILINPITGRLNPLEIVCRGRLPARHDPKTVECGVRGPFKLQPATHMRHRGRGPTIVEREVPGPSRRRPAAHDSTPAAAQQESEQHPSTQAVDFSQGTIEPDNPFMRQDIERLEAAIRQSKVRIAREQKILRQRRHDMRQANRQLHCPFPGAWPSGSSHSGSENVSRTSQLPTKASLASSELNSGRPDHNIRTGVLHRQNGGVRRPTRARVDTHARHDERPNRHEIASWQRRMLDGLLLAYNSGADTVWNALPNRVRRLIGG